MNTTWINWLRANWQSMVDGGKVPVPKWLGHPRWQGYVRPPMAEPVGQVADWVCSIADGSRVHIHEYPDGSLVAHRDRIDPARGPLEAMMHWMTEAPSGQLAVFLAMLILAAKAMEEA